MNTLPQAFLDAWENKEPRMIFSTADAKGEPNSVWVLCVKLLDNDRVLIANNFFSKTLENIKSNNRGALLMIAPEREAYQIKGSLEYYTEGEIFDDMKSWLDPKFAGVGATILNIESIYYGTEKVL